MSSAKNIGKSLSNKYDQKLLDSAKKSTTGAIKTASKRAIQETAETAADLIGKKIADKMISSSNSKESCFKELPNDEIETDTVSPKDTPKKRYIASEERQRIIGELRLV